MSEMEDQKKFAEQMLGATFEFAKLAISSLILLNAGAATALLAFIGSHHEATVPASLALLSFAVGAGLGGIGSVSAYVGQRLDWELATGRRNSRFATDVFVRLAIACVLVGYVFFFVGCVMAAADIPQAKIETAVSVQTVQSVVPAGSPIVMDTALYYTYSTIAQSLAAAMALLAAFAMFRMNAIGAECLHSAVAMEGDTGGGSGVRVLAISSDWSGVRKEIEERVKGQTYQYRKDEMLSRLDRIDQLLTANRRIVTALWVSLGLTALVVALSVGVLANVPVISASEHARSWLNAGIGATVASLLTYIWLVIAAFRR
jgi:hypothetical protein